MKLNPQNQRASFHSPHNERGAGTVRVALWTTGLVTAVVIGVNAYQHPPSETTAVPDGSHGVASDTATGAPNPSPSPAHPSVKAKNKRVAPPSADYGNKVILGYGDKNWASMAWRSDLVRLGCGGAQNGEDQESFNYMAAYETRIFQINAKLPKAPSKSQLTKSVVKETIVGHKTARTAKWLLAAGDTTCGASYAPTNRTPGCQNSASGGAPVYGPAIPGTICKDGTTPNPDSNVKPGCPGSSIGNWPIAVKCRAYKKFPAGTYKLGELVTKS